ncbi:MAG TPA: hypothetical protein VM364_04200 [Vicinamibacterales bacterium]|nr:hypothetical protein [Vicinamibacterales bacterium]
MQMRTWMVVGGLSFGVSALPAPTIAQDTGTQPVLHVGLRAVKSDGSRGRDAAWETINKPGETFSAWVHAGRVGTADEQLCVMRAAGRGGTLTEVDKRGLDTALHAWKFSHTLVSHEGGRQVVDFDWQRFDRGSPTPAASGKQRLTLGEGQTQFLDLVHGRSGPPCDTVAVAFEVTAKTREDPALADTVLRYDLWLVRQDRSGRKERRHVILSALQGTAPEFHFPPLHAEVPKLQPDQYDFRVATRVGGSIRGRLTRDGRVVLELETYRSDVLEQPASRPPSRPGRGGSGRKVLTAAIGEAIEVQLPPAGGYSSTFATAKAEGERAAPPAGSPLSREPVTVKNGRIEVSYGPFFEGERLSIILQVRKPDGTPDDGVALPVVAAAGR